MKLRLIILSLAALLFFSDCQKYPNGPTFSIRPRLLRVAESWQYNEVYRNGLSIYFGTQHDDIDYSRSSIGFNEDNRFSYNITVIDTAQVAGRVTFRGDGDWEFLNDDTELQLTFDNVPAGLPISGPVQVYEILRLQENYLWLSQDIGNGNTNEFRLIPN